MDVNHFALFPTRLLTIQFPDTQSLNEDLCELLQRDIRFGDSFNMHPDALNLLSLVETEPAIARLRDMFLEGLNQWLTAAEMARPAAVDLVMFSNYARQGEYTVIHNHNADIVGIYYARTTGYDHPVIEFPSANDDYFDPGDGVLVLHDPRFNANLAAAGDDDHVRVFPRSGLMLLFPGYLWHSVSPHLGNFHRLSFSMNITLRQQDGSHAVRHVLC